MISLKRIIVEIGEGSLEPYDYSEVLDPGIRKAEYAFETDENQYLVDFDFEGPQELDGTASHMHFTVLGEDPSHMTGEHKTLRVVTTVMEIAKEYVEKYLLDSGLSYLIFKGASKDDNVSSSLDTQRSKIYFRFLKENFPNAEISKRKINGSDYIVVDLDSLR